MTLDLVDGRSVHQEVMEKDDIAGAACDLDRLVRIEVAYRLLERALPAIGWR
jgi:hypothetical protein